MSKSEIIEEWRDITGYEGLYQVSNLGRVRSLDRYVESKIICKSFIKGKILNTSFQKNGYVVITLSKSGKRKQFKIHRLVAQAFISNFENKPEVNHKDGDKTNNCSDNLEWVTRKENNQHAFDTGLNNNHSKKLTDDEIRTVRQEYIPYSRKYSTLTLAKKYKVSRPTISQILKEKRYKNVK